MKYFAIILRILIIVIWVQMLILAEWKPHTPPFCSGIGFILIGLYLALQAIMWPKSMICPFFGGCKIDANKK